ncbi:hypothetical protein D3C83_200950 [compost metagenome]
MHLGHADVDERDLGGETFGGADRFRAVVGDAHVVPAGGEQLPQAVGEIDVVIGEQHAPAMGPRRRDA